jgi:acetate kinase
MDAAANAVMTAGRCGVISAAGPGPCAAVVATDEEWMIACDAAEVAARASAAMENA